MGCTGVCVLVCVAAVFFVGVLVGVVVGAMVTVGSNVTVGGGRGVKVGFGVRVGRGVGDAAIAWTTCTILGGVPRIADVTTTSATEAVMPITPHTKTRMITKTIHGFV